MNRAAMKALSITGLVLGACAPLLMLLPLLVAPFGGDDFWQAGWAFFFFTVPLGILLAIAAATLVIIGASLAIRRGFHPIAVPIVGICLVGVGLLLELIGVAGFITGFGDWGGPALGLGVVTFIAGVIMSAISGLRPAQL